MKCLLVCLVFAAGEGCGFVLARFSELWPVLIFLTAMLALGGYGFAIRAWEWGVLFLVGMILSLIVMDRRRMVLREALELNRAQPFVARFVVREPVTGNSFCSELASLKVRVMIASPELRSRPSAGDVWECAGWLERLPKDDLSRQRTFWVKGRGTFARCIRPIVKSRVRGFLFRVRRNLSRRMGIGVSEQSANLTRAILLGERTGLPLADKQAFVAAGTIHVFAISGLHVMSVAGILSLFVRLLAIPYRFSGLVLIPVLWGYVLLIGAPPSALRAATMASLAFAAPFGWRRPNGLVAWSLTFLLVYGIDPMKWFDVGCALSFTVMLGLMLWQAGVGRFLDSGFWSSFGQSAAAWMVSVPIAAYVFGRLTPGGVLANLLLLPAAGLSVGAGCLGILASFFSEVLAAYVNNFAALTTEVMSDVSYLVAALPGSNFEIVPWTLIVGFEWYVACALGCWWIGAVRRRHCL